MISYQFRLIHGPHRYLKVKITSIQGKYTWENPVFKLIRLPLFDRGISNQTKTYVIIKCVPGLQRRTFYTKNDTTFVKMSSYHSF